MLHRHRLARMLSLSLALATTAGVAHAQFRETPTSQPGHAKLADGKAPTLGGGPPPASLPPLPLRDLGESKPLPKSDPKGPVISLPPTGPLTIPQPSPPTTAPGSSAPAPCNTCTSPIAFMPPPAPMSWASADLLVWWTKGHDLPPIVSTGSIADGLSAGALGLPGTRVLYGGQSVEVGAHVGFGARVGTWLDKERTWGLEFGGFLLPNRSDSFSIGGNNAGVPLLGIPVFRSDLGREGVLAFSSPDQANGILVGSLNAQVRTLVWGVDAAVHRTLARSCDYSITGLIGYRNINLIERFDLGGRGRDPLNDVNYSIQESFRTGNNFHGVQLGGRVQMNMNSLSFDVLARIALGVNAQSVRIDGRTSLNGAGVNGVFQLPEGVYPGGAFAQRTNIGRHTSTNFSVVPELAFNARYQINSSFAVTAGYSFLFWTGVVRAGDELDRNVNATQSVLINGVLNGAPRPESRFDRTTFWAHGLNLGFELRY